MKTIALAMIVRNEERSLARALRSAEPFVDRMLVLDTGSTDRTMEVARDCGAEVFERRWTHDFSAARNAILSQSTADYNLVLDADEWIVSGGELLTTLREIRKPAVYRLKFRSALSNDAANSQSFSWISRVLPKGVRYRGRVHEQPNHRLPTPLLECVIGHDGYLEDRLLAKRGRNRALLEKALADNPEDAYSLYQLGKDGDIYSGPEAAVPYYWQALELAHPNAPWRHDLVMRLLVCLPRIEQTDKALLLAADEMNNWAHSADFHYLAADMMLSHFTKNPGQGQSLLPMIEHCLTTALKIGDTTDLSGAMSGRGSYLAAEKLWVLYQAQGKTEEAKFYATLRDELHLAHLARIEA